MTTALDYALQFAERGWFVFPLLPTKKLPYKDFTWKELSTNDIQKIRATATHPRYKNCNWALDCGKSNITVLDVDVKKDLTHGERDGRKTLIEMGVSFNSLANLTYYVQTPSGGYHFYFNGALPNSVEDLGVGLDTRGIGGYVVIPGSLSDSAGALVYKEKRSLKSTPILLNTPQWIKEKLPNSTNKKENRDIPVCDLDKAENIRYAFNYLHNSAPKAIEGQGGNNATYKIACRIRDFGLSEPKALELLLTEWNDINARPPWPLDDLRRIVHSAYSHAKDRPGNASIDTLFPEDINAIIPKTAGIRCAKDINPHGIKPRPWILGRRYLPGYVTVTIAPGGVGKSLFTILEGLSISSNIQMTYDHVYRTGPVWIYNAEDPFDELERRIAATALHYGLTGDNLKYLYYTSGYDMPFKLAAYDQRQRPVANTGMIDALISHIAQRNIKLFIVDPFVRCHALKENDNDGIDFVMQIFQRIAAATACAISVVHHTKKKSIAGDTHGDMDMARGASSLVYAARIAHTLYPMTAKEAKIYGVPPIERNKYIRMDNAKANLSLVTGKELWYKKQSISINKDDTETTGVLERAEDLVPTLLDQTDKLIIDIITRAVGEGESKTVYALAKHVTSTQLVNLKDRQLIRKIQELFELPFYRNHKQGRSCGGEDGSGSGGLTWRLTYQPGKKGNDAAFISCYAEINEG